MMAEDAVDKDYHCKVCKDKLCMSNTGNEASQCQHAGDRNIKPISFQQIHRLCLDLWLYVCMSGCMCVCVSARMYMVTWFNPLKDSLWC